MDTNSSQVDLLRFGAFELDLAAGELRKNSRRVLLQPQPFRILTLLVSRPGVLITREQVKHELWDGAVSVDFEQGMNFCIRRIRLALGDDAESPRYIETVRKDVLWVKGKKSPILKMVDRAAKAAGKFPSQVDRGFRSGKVGKSKIAGERSSSSLFPASGQIAMIRIYRSQMIRKAHHRVTFDVFDSVCGSFTYKSRAYVPETLIGGLHRHHCYRVRFNTEPGYPLIVEILSEWPCDNPEPMADAHDSNAIPKS